MDTKDQIILLILLAVIVKFVLYKLTQLKPLITLGNLPIIILIIISPLIFYLTYKLFFYRLEIRKENLQIVEQKDSSKLMNKETKVSQAETIDIEQENTDNNQQQNISNENVAMAKPEKQRSVNIKVDSEGMFYRHRKLNVDEVKYLAYKGYKQLKCLDIQGHKENFLIKPRANEGVEHCFLVYNITEYLKSKKIKFQLFNSVKPDVEIKINNKKIALEIETGKVFKKDKKKFYKKVKSLNQNYGKNWFFIVTDWNLAPIYSKFGKTLTKRNFIKKFENHIKNQ